ncbi:hypothetical protein O181_107664, partial [Austropuccinia psidii MF-1]|nr:hypothetical protein [Austropuccinia psidii MF-1]
MSELPEKIPLIILDSSESPALFFTNHTRYMVKLPSFPNFEWDFSVLNTPKGEDLILGFDFLNHFTPSIGGSKGLSPLMLIKRTIMILWILSVTPFLLPNHVQLWLVILEHHQFYLLSIFLPLIPISHYHHLKMRPSKRFKMLEKITLGGSHLDL